MNFQYCKQCLENNRSAECDYTYIITDVFGGKYKHISCPDQEFRGQTNVDMKFINTESSDTLEIEVKSIQVEFEETNNRAHDKFMGKLQEDLSEVIDTCVALLVNIELKQNINSSIYQVEIKDKLVEQIRNIDFDYMELPKVFENEFCKVVADDIPEKFKDSHLMFAIANPPIGGKPKEITISEIEDTIMNLDGVIGKINDYLIDGKVRKKYKNTFSKKVILFTLEYALVLGGFANIYNEIYKGELYERIMNSIGENIYSNDFFHQIIIVLEPMDSNNAIYCVI